MTECHRHGNCKFVLKEMNMKRLLFILLIVPVFATAQERAVVDLDAKTFAKAIVEDETALVIDVRTEPEYNAGHLEGVLHLDWYENFKEVAEMLPRDKSFYLYCTVGGRSGQAAEYLIAQGYEKVYNLQGGIKAWKGKVVKEE